MSSFALLLNLESSSLKEPTRGVFREMSPRWQDTSERRRRREENETEKRSFQLQYTRRHRRKERKSRTAALSSRLSVRPVHCPTSLQVSASGTDASGELLQAPKKGSTMNGHTEERRRSGDEQLQPITRKNPESSVYGVDSGLGVRKEKAREAA